MRVVDDRMERYYPRPEPRDAARPLLQLLRCLPAEFPNDPKVAAAAVRLKELLDEWIEKNEEERSDDDSTERPHLASSGSGATTEPLPFDRSVFDDLVLGRIE